MEEIREVGMNTQIYYFSGTGNSMFIAKELQRRIPEAELIPMVSLLEYSIRTQKPIRLGSGSVGLVFPVHALTLPIAVKRFLEHADVSACSYFFAVATRGGSAFKGFEKINRLLAKKGKQLDARCILNMGNNEARHGPYAAPTQAELSSMEETALRKLDELAECLQNRRKYLHEDADKKYDIVENPILNHLMENLVVTGIAASEYIGGVQYFFNDERCSGCGSCEKVCLSQKITMHDGKPVWQRNVLCYMCFACLNYCPLQSVQIKSIPGVPSSTRENDRYSHPYASAADIAAQKAGSVD